MDFAAELLKLGKNPFGSELLIYVPLAVQKRIGLRHSKVHFHLGAANQNRPWGIGLNKWADILYNHYIINAQKAKG